MTTTKLVSLIILLLVLSACSSVINVTRDKPIAENKSERSFGKIIDDEVIETKALVNLRQTSPELDQAHLVVVSYNGTVLLAGQVPTDDIVQQAGVIVRSLGEVKTLHNQLTAEPSLGFGTRSSDTWITSKLKTKMLAGSATDGGNIKVVTENSTVYLMGLITREMATKAADIARNTSGVERVVKIFEYID
jgi:osmotically-inducible protein OsmY|tara:strand:+ start:2974 stop:3546 length:573 start_codon:yes stop_codon:yes gene_type:complete